MKSFVQDSLFSDSLPTGDETDEVKPAWAVKLEAWISDGHPIEIQTTMTVCGLQCMWEGAWQRGQDASGKLTRFARKLEERRRKATPIEKLSLTGKIQRAHQMAGHAQAYAEYTFIEAQHQFNETLPLDEKQREIFWEDVSVRPGIEHTWELTLQQVIDHLKPLKFE